MNEILGMLLPFLFSGDSSSGALLNILNAFSGQTFGAANTDGLASARTTQLLNARSKFPAVPDTKSINRSIDMVVDRLGINPTSGEGQGAAAFIRGLHALSPDFVGTIAGIPDGSKFFSMIANGAPGISMASGGGMTDVTNPYSVMAAHERSVKMARSMYDMALRPDGGYDVSYGHGLNMTEIGEVTQRLLSSGIPYKQYVKRLGQKEADFSTETGRILNPEDEKTAVWTTP